MPTGIYPTPPGKENQRIVDIQGNDGGASGSRQTKQPDAGFVPNKVVSPLLLAWMIEWDSFTGERINRTNLFAFGFIAGPTGTAKIRESCAATGGSGDNMVSC